MTNPRTWGTGLSFILLPLIFVFGFASHPNLAQLAPPDYGDASAWIAEFHGNRLWAIGHTAVMWSNVPALVVFLGLMTLLREKAGTLSLIAGSLGVVGCLMLVADKAALTLVPTAFETLPEEQFRQLTPGLDAMIQYKGYLWMVKLYALIPIGFALMAIGLFKTKLLPRWQSVAIFVGALLLLNPDIDLLSLIASLLLGAGLIPMGWRILTSPATWPAAPGGDTRSGAPFRRAS